MLMNRIKTLFSIRKMLFGLLACSMLSCDGDLDLAGGGVKGSPHDPSKPIEVTKFEPATGTSGQQMVIYGKNFGNDPSIIRVSFGGAEAVVVSASGDAIYCLVPEKSAADDFVGFEDNSDGEDVTDEDVTEDETPVSQTEDDKDEEKDSSARTVYVGVGHYDDMRVESFEENYFFYKKEWKVRTLAGKVNEKKEDDARTDTRPLPLEDCGNFPLPQNFVFDPVNPDHLWLSGDVGSGIRLIDLKNRTITYFGLPMSGWSANNNRVRKIAFTYDENHNMVIATDHPTRDQPTIWLLKRNSPTASGIEAFKTGDNFNAVGLIGSSSNGVAVHPKTNSLFFSSWSSTEIIKFPNHKTNPDLLGNVMGIYDWINNNKGFVKDRDVSACEMQFGFGESSYESLILIHPEGKYMFTLCINMDFIAKSFYNEADDTFGSYIWFVGSSVHAGQGGGAGYINDIGMKAKMNEPREGVFVKNPVYVEQGKSDVYDFYFTDVHNHCIRKVTPEGVVTTFAGRGRVTEGDAWGYADGLARSEAMFDRPSAIAYSEKTNTFYVGDVINKRIREIYYD